MSIPVKVTVTVSLERQEPNGQLNAYGNIASFLVQGPGKDDDPPDVRTANLARSIFMQAAQQMRDSINKARAN